jgi:type III secretion protein HrpB1
MQEIGMTREHGHAMASALLHAIGDERFDEAEMWLERLRELNQVSPEHPDILMFRTLIAIQRGQAVDALRYLNSLGEDICPDVRVLCLYFAQDATWEGLATELAEHSPHAHIRESMSLLINRSAQS